MQNLNRLTSILCSSLLAMGMFACDPADDIDLSNSDKDDSFARPTEHGKLNFEVTNTGSFSDVYNFHSWTFTLSDKADIELFTEVSNNLDTVMYLYKRKPGTTRWGAAIAKNDDFARSLGSRIILKDAVAGEYRVKIKATKILLRGAFDLMASCDGAGCPTPDAPIGPSVLPAKGMTEECAGTFMEVIATKTKTLGSRRSIRFPNPNVSGLTAIEQKAFGQFVDYWDEYVGFEDNFGSSPTVKLRARETQGGTVVELEVSIDDESGMTMVYDQDQKLVMLVQHNQTPDAQWFCDESEGEKIDEPEIECARTMVNSLQHSRSRKKERHTSMGKLIDMNLDSRVRCGVDAIDDMHSPDEDSDFTLYSATWSDMGTGASIAYDGPFGIGTFYVDGDDELLAEVNEEGTAFFYCE